MITYSRSTRSLDAATRIMAGFIVVVWPGTETNAKVRRATWRVPASRERLLRRIPSWGRWRLEAPRFSNEDAPARR